MNGFVDSVKVVDRESGLNSIFNRILSQIPENIDLLESQQMIADSVSHLSNAERSAIRNLFESFLVHMRELEASDIEMGGATANSHIWFRVQGQKKPRTELGIWPTEQTDIIAHCLLSDKQRERLFTRRAVDFSYAMQRPEGLWRWRASLYFDMGHLALNMRAILGTVYPYAKLGFHPVISRAFSLRYEKQGLILFTGITGSGKSTSLDSIIDANNRSVDGHIVIIGDPIEYIHTSKLCIIRHREVGRDVNSFKDGAIQALRQDPDIIVVGEMRDPDTIMTCLEIVDTGHKVFSTLHTGSAVETIDRIIAETPTEEQERVRNRLADVLRVVISQKLLPGIDGRLIMAKEVLLVTTSVRAAIRNRNVQEIYQMISENNRVGMITLEQDLVRLVHERLIDEKVALDYANNKRRFQELMGY
ncbi:MAG TPA: ATPase, T2SS/T4P/T4SS family [bacterium]|nr:ATPase, T2SS/T4P/T4SS family [bacterium]HQG44786.1 ATPase, T2SS/T4P/T4SS family [bacterium]HQI49179.1 ATPase, T2SS/T4P/T4SS family [bacterium]HQJ64846.1 ATPase, T2SS/T4P/T4SS family [bacterium]